MAEKLAVKTDVITIIGAGLQGTSCLLCMSKRLKIKEVRICDLSAKAKQDFIKKFEGYDFNVVDYESIEDACKESDVVITITTANADLVKDGWLKKGALIMTMGSFRETSFDLVRNADVLAVDHPEQAMHRGNFKELSEMGEITLDSFGAILPLVLAGKQQGRKSKDDIICAEIVGMGCPDVAVANLVYERVLKAKADVAVVDMTK